MTRPRFFVTTAIDYSNGEPHMGHALEKIGADAIARFHRLAGYDVHFLMGMDEHGQKVAQAAASAGVTPQAFVDRIAASFEAAWKQLDISHDEFVRTTSAHHKAGVVALIEQIFANNPDDFYEKSYGGLYCVGCEAFKTDADIVDGKCALHPTRTIEHVEERNWFFRLSRYQQPLLELFARNPGFFKPDHRRNEILRVIEGGLEDISASRARFTWGVPFPRPLATGETQTTYVWFDALPNYWTVTRGADARAKWPAQLHVIGKDITRFHTVIWPAMLMSAGIPLPEHVWAHGFVSFGGERFSKSAGVKIELADAAGRHGIDAFRYYMLREVPFDDDGNFSWERFAEVYDSELANTLGNLASRTIAMVEKYFGGEVPRVAGAGELSGPATVRLRANAIVPVNVADTGAPEPAERGYRFSEFIAAVMACARDANEFIQRKQPWALAKDPAKKEELAAVLAALVRDLAAYAVALSPIMPGKSQELWRSIGGTGKLDAFSLDGLATLDVGGWRVTKGTPLFPRIEQASESAT